ncbi:MAG TPA: COX15/CtaA family protein [Vicinamibacterales bacterium]|nr:COX15/CtaA family protein [Vicinamibacterales bacterium]
MTWLHRYARVLAAATLLLIAAGGLVTSTESGLAVPDWPTTYGQNMFTFPLDGMVGGILYEHGHRLIASGVGLLTIGLVIWLGYVERRRWVRRLGWIALAAVIVQGTLGGITVLFFLPPPVSIGHAGLAQIFFCLTVAIALVTSAGWRRPDVEPVDDPVLSRRMVTLTAVVFAQILIGATMRHTGAGLAIPDFPLAFGALWPSSWTPDIAIHYAHRVGAAIVTVLVIANVIYLRRTWPNRRELARPAWLLVALLVVQVSLGALVIWTGKQFVINTLHVATGAAVLATSLVITLRTFRVRVADALATA